MVLTEALPYEVITEQLSKDDTISIVSCNNCVRVVGTGGEEKMKELALRLREDGYDVRDGFLITKACPQSYMGAVKPNPRVDTVIVLACYAGWSNAKRMFPGLKVVLTTKSVGLLITDSDKGVVKMIKAFDDFTDRLGYEFEIGTGKRMPSEQIKMEE